MLTYIRFSNFYSYLQSTEISFMLGKQPTASDYDFTLSTVNDQYRLNKVMAVLGANGSGKTQLLKAFAFLRFFICGSMSRLETEEIIPFNQFALCSHGISEFELGFLLKNGQGTWDEYRYELILKQNKVIKEALYKKTSRLFSYVFMRESNEDSDNKSFIYKHRDFIMPSLANDVKPNASLISYANLLDHILAGQIVDLLYSYKTNVTSSGRLNLPGYAISEITELFNDDVSLKESAEKLLCQFDTGIERINVKEVLMISEDKQEQKKILLPFGVHRTEDDKEFELVFYEESNGTQSAYRLLGQILPVLKQGGVAIIDELDNDLHPLLLPEILNLFRSKYHNPHNAQLIFSCHTPEVFNLLHKHQIYLVEKISQMSEAWRLDNVEGVRNDDNLYAKYMAGAFDAIPNV